MLIRHNVNAVIADEQQMRGTNMRKIYIFDYRLQKEVPFIGVNNISDAFNIKEYREVTEKLIPNNDGVDIDKIKDDAFLMKLLDEKKAIFKIYRDVSNPTEDKVIRNDLREHGLGDYEFMVMVRSSDDEQQNER